MDQMSFFSGETTAAGLGDLAGVLCGPGQVATSGGATARLSVVVEERWRAAALAAEFERCGVAAEIGVPGTSGECHRLVRTPFREDLLLLARQFSRGAMKSLPPGFRLDGGLLRLWAVACGKPGERGYLLPLDRRAPDTHRPLLAALTRLGLSGTIVGPRGGGPAIRITGRRRLSAFAQLLGQPEEGAQNAWPAASPASRVG